MSLRPGDIGLQMVAEGEGSHGGRLDLTGQVTWSAVPAGVVALEPGGYLRPVAPGKATVRARHEGAESSAAVTVEGDSGRPWDFAEDVVPVLTRLGCNSGGCHGKADGQNGFHLSLFGYDSAGDYLALTRDAGQRRISVLDPERSLLLGKATGRVPHGGARGSPPARPSTAGSWAGSRRVPPSARARRTAP